VIGCIESFNIFYELWPEAAAFHQVTNFVGFTSFFGSALQVFLCSALRQGCQVVYFYAQK
jgi:hypothetical protein